MTPHIEAKLGDYADVVLMPGDPVRATYIANTFLDNVRQVNSIRNCFGYTGTYQGRPVSVQASGMGQPSLGIYSFELFNFYNVSSIIRVGTCGAFNENINIGEVVVAMTSCTENSPAEQAFSNFTFAPCCDYQLLENAVVSLRKHNLKYHVGSICASDYFYQEDTDWWIHLKEHGVIAVDMETHMLYYQAMKARRRALTVNMVSDNIATHEKMPPSERVTRVDTMVKSILDSLL